MNTSPELQLIAFLNWGLARVTATLDTGEYRSNLWTIGCARKTCRCHLCGAMIDSEAKQRSWRRARLPGVLDAPTPTEGARVRNPLVPLPVKGEPFPKPPPGVKPRELFEEDLDYVPPEHRWLRRAQRREEVEAAMWRYVAARVAVPRAWLVELGITPGGDEDNLGTARNETADGK